MRQEFEIELEEAEEALSHGWSLPTHWYSDPTVYAFEAEQILSRKWYVAGPVSKLAKPGDHIVCEIVGTPIVVTRAKDGTIYGFVNMCRHRGHTVASEDGNRQTLQCPYHGWTYGLDGKLTGVPGVDAGDDEHLRQFGIDGRERFKEDQCKLSLLPVQVHVWNEAVFVNPDMGAPSFSGAHPELNEIAKRIGLDLTGYEYYNRYSYDVEANWKYWMENGVECYHCPTVHASTFSVLLDVSLGGYRVRWDRDVIFTEIDYSMEELSKADGVQGRTGWRSTHIYPCAVLGMDDEIGVIAQSFPTGPESCIFRYDLYRNPSCDDDIIRDRAEFWVQAIHEDLAIVATAQPTLRSGRMEHGRVMPWREGATVYMQQLALRAYREALSSGGLPAEASSGRH